MTHGKTYNKSPHRINYKATKNKTNTGTTALDRSVYRQIFGIPMETNYAPLVTDLFLFVMRQIS